MKIVSIHENNDFMVQLIDFNSMSTNRGLFYAKRLENCIHYISILNLCNFLILSISI